MARGYPIRRSRSRRFRDMVQVARYTSATTAKKIRVPTPEKSSARLGSKPMMSGAMMFGHPSGANEIRSNSTFDICKGLSFLPSSAGCRVVASPWGCARDAVERDPSSGLPRPLRVLSDLFARQGYAKYLWREWDSCICSKPATLI